MKISRFLSCVLLFCLPVSGMDIREDARIYEGEHLDAVAMPVGGIGTGTIWVAGDGRLAVWQVFNNSDELPLPDTFLGMYVGGAKGEVRVLQRGDGHGAKGFSDVSCIGEYPLLRIRYRDPALLPDATIWLEAFNPMIPTSTKDSSLPCAIFRLTAENKGEKPLELSFLASLLNPVGYIGGTRLESRFYGGFGANRNVYESVPGGGTMHLSVGDARGPRFGKEVRLFVSGRGERAVVHCGGVTAVGFPRQGIPQVDAIWLEGLTGGESEMVWELLGSAARDGKTVLISGAEKSFYEQLVSLSRGEETTYDHDVFEDFESGTYDGWTVEGAAFGKEPPTGTSPGQQQVSGFYGKRLVNTYVPDDEPQGRLISKPFDIRKRYIGFLVGGGSHAGRTSINLLVDDKVVRTQTGRDRELLEPASWDVAEFRGKKGVIEIVDRASGPWGHINIDHIIFSDTAPQLILAPAKGLEDLLPYLPEGLSGVRSVPVHAEVPSPFPGVVEPWRVEQATGPVGERPDQYEALVSSKDVPLVVSGPFGKGRIVVALAKKLPASWGMTLLAKSLGTTYEHGEGIDRSSRLWGDLTLSALGAGATACARWTDGNTLWKDFGDDGRLEGPLDSGASPVGETYSGAVAMPLEVGPGQSRTVSFALTWCFPNVDRFGHQGNKYADWFRSATDAAEYVRKDFVRLVADTVLYHDTVYASSLPYPILDAFTSQSVILRGPTCWWAKEHKDTKKDYFAGFEGCYGCCPLNCTHVWNYAQSHARLFPEIGRNLRWYDFMHYLRETGETQHRQHSPHGAFIDGHCAVIEGAYREYLMSPDASFLEEIYPRVKLAMEWLIQKIDSDEDGVNGGQQWNTYDVPTDGAHTFLGSQYLSALAAAEKMALVTGDEEATARWRKIREAGSVNQDKKLWNGEYWIQIPDPRPARDYNTGCHSDQLLGQWWSHMLDNGYLYPPERVKTALRSIFRYNFRENFKGFQQRPRRYVLDDEGGMLMCSWPKGGRPDPFILYADEIWTGIEYEVAGLMIYEGLLEEGLAIVKTARDRYDGRVREGLNSGPGGNPFNELECGKFYARAMSSGGLLLACQGFIHEGPEGILGFKPRWQPEEHSSFFCGAEGWGLFTQKRERGRQQEAIECRWGKLRLKELVFQVPSQPENPTVRIGERTLEAEMRRGEGGEVRITIPETTLSRGETLVVEIPLPGSSG